MASSVFIPDPCSFNHQLAQVNGHQYHFVDEGPKDAPLIVLVHGFPESWYCWVYQILFLSRELGFRVVAVDKPGYGETKVGKDLVNYSIKSTCKDLNEIVKNVLGREKAILIGHDWGSQVCWMMCLYFPETVDVVVGILSSIFPSPA
ncbi:hypothetical protein DSO57_1022378 [Entomophthora muscae]|uniref:Uncharacterized protein n=1 Tax=Entomophthora muscae TaxID=34485 RepID=A0ACC2UNI7_9FUNG|nr:hypothetical protein DSO57_1022378 [Entomophthora muscae]